MSRGDKVPPDDVDFLEAGPERGVGAAFRLRRRPMLLLLVVAAVALAVIAVVRSGGSPSGSPAAPPPATGSQSSAPGPSSTASSGVVSTSTVSVTTLGPALPQLFQLSMRNVPILIAAIFSSWTSREAENQPPLSNETFGFWRTRVMRTY
jgi:hypothetical protein